MKIQELADHGIPEKVIKLYKKEGITALYPPQEEAVKAGLLDLKHSFLISVPTASGKTFISELLMVKSILRGRGKCIYIVPLRALAAEKLEEFKKYESIGIRSAISTGELDTTDNWLKNFDIIVTTSEKADSLLRHRSEWLTNVAVLVADEIHLIHDGSRGPTLEVTIARLKHLNPDVLVLGLSATIKNADEMAGWLDAKLISSKWRPVDLKEGIYLDDEIFFNDSRLEKVTRIVKEPHLNLAIETVKNGGQSLIFTNTRLSSEKAALDAAKTVKKFLSNAELKKLSLLTKEVLEALSKPTKICKKLATSILGGTAFHHAGLVAKQKKIVEQAFKANQIKIIAATPTLAAGVNLPARRVVIRDYKRYEPNLGSSSIPVLEIKQMAGRAGRPKYDTCGEAVLIAKSLDERSFLLDNYVLAEPEEISSKLAVESALRTHVLATIATGYANTLHGTLEFFSKTFFAFTKDAFELETVIEKIIDFLKNEGLIERHDDYLHPTPFGKRVSQLYIDPASAVILKDALFRAEKIDTNEISYLHAVSKVPEIRSLYLKKKDYELCIKEQYENAPFFLFDVPGELLDPWKYENFLSELKTALFFKDRINERDEEFILEKFNLAPGDVRTKVDLADWILYSMSEIGRLFKIKKTGEILKLRKRVKHGVKEELLELVSLRGIGRIRARRLYVKGFKTLDDVKKADVKELAKVELIKNKLAEKIKRQLEGKKEKEKEIENETEAEAEKIAGEEDDKTDSQKKLFDF